MPQPNNRNSGTYRNQIAVLLQEYRRVLPAIYRYISSDDVETPNLHVTKNLNISKTKQDIEELKMPLRLVWKRCSVAFKIGSTIFFVEMAL